MVRMIGIVYSTADLVSENIAKGLVASHAFEEIREGVLACEENKDLLVYRIDSPLLSAEFLDSVGLQVLYVLSRHKSEAGVGAMTVHATGNWGPEARLGGKPKQLSQAAPVEMLSALMKLGRINVRVEKTYEATHHGPLLKTPSFFIELGGEEEMLKSKELASKMAEAVFDSASEVINKQAAFSKVVFGVGGTHYPRKFSELAIEKGYAFSHIMAKYAVKNPAGSYNTDMFEQAVSRSSKPPECAVVEWKSLNVELRNCVTKKLEEVGLDYEKV